MRNYAAAITATSGRLDDRFAQAVALLLECRGRVVVCGVGKSGLIGRKLAATFTSTGTPALFLHAGEAVHGDLGMVTPDDVVMFISQSGRTEELVRLLPTVGSLCAGVIAITGDPDSSVARAADVSLNASIEREACPHNLAPTTSGAVALALGDALAIALLEVRGFRPVDFAQLHPGGSLGRRLHTRIRDAMHADGLPFAAPGASFAELVATSSAGGLGSVLVMAHDRLVGIVTDGDLRRAVARAGGTAGLVAADIMSPNPRTIGPDEFLVTADAIMRDARITALVVVEAGAVIGIIQIHD